MFDIGWSEILVIGIVALVVIGPKELPGVVRAVAQNIGKLRRLASDFQNQFNDAVRDMELAELKKDAEKLLSDATTIEEKKSTEEGATPAIAEAPKPKPEQDRGA
jgi:sec-independent protein translocase protein TatB